MLFSVWRQSANDALASPWAAGGRCARRRRHRVALLHTHTHTLERLWRLPATVRRGGLAAGQQQQYSAQSGACVCVCAECTHCAHLCHVRAGVCPGPWGGGGGKAFGGGGSGALLTQCEMCARVCPRPSARWRWAARKEVARQRAPRLARTTRGRQQCSAGRRSGAAPRAPPAGRERTAR